MNGLIDRGRRRLLKAAALTLASARLNEMDIAQPSAGHSREFAAIGRATEWINSPPLTAANLADRVILVQFCTYTCINWLRTLPYMRAWRQKYGDGLAVIGVHTPEFEFEHDVHNVRRSMQQMQVEYPIAIDNEYSIWRAFRNQYWPALYLLDTRGRVRHHHFGEGEYQQSELALHRLVPANGGAASFVAVNGTGVEAPADWSNLRTSETYLGSARANLPSLQEQQWSLAGAWTISRDAARLTRPTGAIFFRFHARDLHLVMGPLRFGSQIRFRVLLDGRPPGAAHGLDVDANGSGLAVEQRLYQLIRQTGKITERRCEIQFLDPDIEAFSFTFG